MIYKYHGSYIKDDEPIEKYNCFLSHYVDGSEIIYVRTHRYNIKDELGYMYVIFRNDNVIDTVFVPDGTTFGMFPAKCEKCKLLSYDIHIANCVEK